MALVRTVHGRLVWDRRVEVLSDQLAQLLPADARVLDVGCGDGTIAAEVMAHRPDVTITGIDVLVRPQTKIDVSEFDGRTIPFGDNTFDAVTFVDVLHHTDDATVLLREAARVTSTAVVIKDHLADGFLAGPTLRAMDWVGNASYGVALPYNYWTQAQWDTAFADVGLEVERAVTDLGLYAVPLSWAFDRRLHVVWRLALRPTEPGRSG
jgi:SAM-dependent methyltransferase